MVDMAVHMVRMGLSCRETSIRLKDIYGTTVGHQAVANWARRSGIRFIGRSRFRPCKYCGSRTLHKRSCPVYRQVIQTVRFKKDEKVELTVNRIRGYVR